MSLTNALDSFILEQKLRGNTDKTILAYEWFINHFIYWLNQSGVTTLDELTLKHVQQYQLYVDSKPAVRKRGKLKKKSVQTYMRHVKAFLRFCYEERFITEPIKIRLPKAERPTIEIFTNEEMETIFKSFTDSEICTRNKTIIMILLDCGLRISEAVNLQIKNINFDRGYIKVIGKGRRERIVPIGQKVSSMITTYTRKRTPAVNPDDNEYLFLTDQQTPITIPCMKSLMKRLKTRTGIRRLHAHLFRHTFATNFLVYGLGDIYELSRLLGHSQLTTTDMYIQLASYYTILVNKRSISYLDTL